MDVQAALPGLRAAAESLMVDSCVVGRKTSGGVLNEETGEYEPGFESVYEGPCKLKAAAVQAQDVDAQSQLLIIQQQTLSLPVAGSEGVRPGMVARVTLRNDPDVGVVEVRVVAPHQQTFSSARRFPVELVS